jgi:predicted nucleotidyltransferase
MTLLPQSDKDIFAILSEVYAFSKGRFEDRLSYVILFGSYARGDYNKESDLDVMVVADVSKDELMTHRSAFTQYCSDVDIERGVFISFVLRDKATFDYWRNEHPFYKNVLAEGVFINGEYSSSDEPS